MTIQKSDISAIVKDNEQAVLRALDSADYIQTFLLVHALIESLLRVFLNKQESRLTFDELIKEYQKFLTEVQYPIPTFVEQLTQFNRRRNRMIHDLWKKGHSLTNQQAKGAAQASIMMYGLFIEWLETFDPDIVNSGFEYDG